MYLIQQITDDPFQQQTLVLPDGTQIGFTMQYNPNTTIWNASLTYGSNFALNGIQIVNNPNLLQQWINQIPFGLACFSSGEREPLLITDFSSAYSSLYVLSSSDVETYQTLLQTGAI